MQPERAGRVYLVGAGPGDPELLTLKAVRAIAAADAILIDQLVNPAVLLHARADVELVDVGKCKGRHQVPQRLIERMLVERARRGQTVVRLKGGDPFIFGRGGEEAQALAAAGIAWEVVCGVSSGIAAAAYAGIPLLHRAHSSSVAFVSGHASGAVAKLDAETLVVFMGGGRLALLGRELLDAGRRARTPIALIRSGTLASQAVFTGTLGELARLGGWEPGSPVLLVIGEVVALSYELHWFGERARALGELAFDAVLAAAG